MPVVFFTTKSALPEVEIRENLTHLGLSGMQFYYSATEVHKKYTNFGLFDSVDNEETRKEVIAAQKVEIMVWNTQDLLKKVVVLGGLDNHIPPDILDLLLVNVALNDDLKAKLDVFMTNFIKAGKIHNEDISRVKIYLDKAINIFGEKAVFMGIELGALEVAKLFSSDQLFMDALSELGEGEDGDALNAAKAKFLTEIFTAAATVAISIYDIAKCVISLRESCRSMEEISIFARNFIPKIDSLIGNFDDLIETTKQRKNGTISLEQFFTNLMALYEESLRVINQILEITIPGIQKRLLELAHQNEKFKQFAKDRMIASILGFGFDIADIANASSKGVETAVQKIYLALHVTKGVAHAGSCVTELATLAILHKHTAVIKTNASLYQQIETEMKFLKSEVDIGVSRVNQRNESLLLMMEERYQGCLLKLRECKQSLEKEIKDPKVCVVS